MVADIGGTNARFAILDKNNKPRLIKSYKCKQFPCLFDAINSYLSENDLSPPSHAAIAVATPVMTDTIKLTNHFWNFSITELKQQLGAESLQVINDFTAQALAVPLLNAEHVIKCGGGEGIKKANIAVIGPGTGLGVSGLVFANQDWHPVTGEGGHASFYPNTTKGIQVIEYLSRKYDHVSAERVLSGQGIVNIYESLCDLESKPFDKSITPAIITANADKCRISRQTLELFFNMLGTIAGNLVLTLGAQRGVYIAGGIVPKIKELFLASNFRQSFEAKGRFRSYLEQVPSYLVMDSNIALTGLSSFFRTN